VNTLLKVAGVVTGMIGGFLTGLWAIFLSPVYAGTIPLPVSPVLAIVTNVALIWYVRRVTGSLGLSLLPGVVWFATMLIGASGGPGGDALIPSNKYGYMGLATIVVGAAAWAIVAYRQVLNRPAPAGFAASATRPRANPAGSVAQRANPAGSAAPGANPSGSVASRAAKAGPAKTAGAATPESTDADPVEPAPAGSPKAAKAAGSRPKSSAKRSAGSSKSPRPGGRR
jgi:hypothetical protein